MPEAFEEAAIGVLDAETTRGEGQTAGEPEARE
jgi:hypothetical protein